MHHSLCIDDTDTLVGPGPARAPAWAAVIAAVSSVLCLAAPTAAQPAEASPSEPGTVDVRLRAGFSGGAGFLVLSTNGMNGTNGTTFVEPSSHLAGRLGLQVGPYFSAYYQNMPTLVIATDSSGTVLFDYNSFLADLTVADRVDFAFGPSADVVALWANGSSFVTPLFGLHARLAFSLAKEPRRQGPRRKGLSLGIDMHPTFGPGGTFVTAQVGLGYEWY
jgi:hypothetical protein